MKRFLLARHGETPWNREGRIQGWSSVALSETGRQQAVALGEFIASEYETVDAVYASDLPRAVETATLACAAGDFEDVPITYDNAWRERDFGVYQGYDSESFFADHPEFAILDNGQSAAAAVPEGGESYLAFRDRVRSAWSELLEEPTELGLLVAHGGVMRTILGAILDMNMRDALRDLHHENAAVAEISYDQRAEQAHVVHRGRVGHLREAPGHPEEALSEGNG